MKLSKKDLLNLSLLTFFFILSVIIFVVCDDDSKAQDPYNVAAAGDTVYTHILSVENGNIGIRIQIPNEPRYSDGAPIVVNSSGWFAGNYNFNLGWDFTEIGAIWVNYIWPGQTDNQTGISSDGVYDYVGPNCIAGFRDVIKFSCGQIPDTAGRYIDELIEMKVLTDNVGLHASSHSGVGATLVMAEYGSEFPNLKYFIGRENPTVDANYAMETGHFEPDYGHEREHIVNPFYKPELYCRDSLVIDYSLLKPYI
ncbi:MAG: hypothetical protein ACLFSQ_12855 [Candidatus Zixiibacteriota bacterium]